jgi:hypothetical protein
MPDIISLVAEHYDAYIQHNNYLDPNIMHGTLWVPVGLQFWVYPVLRPNDKHHAEYQRLTHVRAKDLEYEIEERLSDTLWHVIRRSYATGEHETISLPANNDEIDIEIVTDFSNHGPMDEATLQWHHLKEE